MRVNTMITKGKEFDLSSNSPNWFFREMNRERLENLYVDIEALRDKSKTNFKGHLAHWAEKGREVLAIQLIFGTC